MKNVLLVAWLVLCLPIMFWRNVLDAMAMGGILYGMAVSFSPLTSTGQCIIAAVMIAMGVQWVIYRAKAMSSEQKVWRY